MYIKIKDTLLVIMMLCLAISTTAAMAQDDAIRRIRAQGEIRVGLAESIPFQSRNAVTGKWEGFNVDMANNLADVLGVKLTVVDASWATLINGLLTNQYDLIMTSIFATPERAVQVIFTETYSTVGEVVIVHKNSTKGNQSDMNGASEVFAVLAGTTNERTAKTYFPNATVNSLTTENQAATFMEVINMRATATVTDASSAKRFLKSQPDAPLKILEPDRLLNKSRRAYAVMPGEYHFLNFLNNWIQAQKLTGRLDELELKWEVN